MIKLTFHVDDDISRADLIRLLSVDAAYLCISEMQELLRKTLKYGSIPGSNVQLTDDQIDTVEIIRSKFFEICEDLPEKF